MSHRQNQTGSNSPSTQAKTPILRTPFTNKGLEAAPVQNTRPKRRVVSEDEIRICAYRKWEHSGKPSGDGVQF